MVSINEELELAKSAKGAIKALLTATSKQAALATLKDAYRAAVLNFSGWPAPGSEDTELGCFDGAGGGSWRDGSLRESSSLRPCA